jgi:SulP family sulfate permease
VQRPRFDLRSWWAANRVDGRTLRSEAVAGVPGAIGSVPDGMAASVLAGVNPIHGLYASLVGPIAGGLFSSTRLMVVTTTSAAALAAGSVLAGVPAQDRSAALLLLTLLAGALMVVASILRLGRYVRFVSHSVMMGFLTGVAANIVLGQFGDLTGMTGEGDYAVTRAWSVLTAPGEWDRATVLVGLAAMALVVGLARTPLSGYAAVVALVVPTAALALGDIDGVTRVGDVGDIPSSLPTLALPRLGLLTPDLLLGAFAVAVIVLVQGAGVSESAPNEDGSRSDANGDFLGQGMGNLAAGLLQGQPVGGSVGQTALNVKAGATTRWASVASGVWMALIVVVFARLVGNVAMATLAAVLVTAAIGSVRVGEIRTVYLSGVNSRIALTSTFIATLVLPVPAAVGTGVVLSLLLQLNQELVDLRVVELRRRPDGTYEELPAPGAAPSRSVTVLHAYGSLLYAGTRTLQAHLPDPAGTDRPVVVLRLRGRTSLGATFLVVMADYAERLSAAGGHLFLAGVDPAVQSWIEHTDRLELGGSVDLVPATPILGEATGEALARAEAWLREAIDTDEGAP